MVPLQLQFSMLVPSSSLPEWLSTLAKCPACKQEFTVLNMNRANYAGSRRGLRVGDSSGYFYASWKITYVPIFATIADFLGDLCG